MEEVCSCLWVAEEVGVYCPLGLGAEGAGLGVASASWEVEDLHVHCTM